MNPNENDEDTKYCFNCRRNIPLCNYEMHTAYCHRNLKLCMKCDEPFTYPEFEEHQKTKHAQISCDDCSRILEAIDLESHKLNNCPHRMKTCNYCDIDIVASSLMAHVDVCSSRTERCHDCGQFIMLKYFAVHRESHALKKIPNVAKPLLDDSPESLAAYPLLTKKVPNVAVGGPVRGTIRTTSMPTLRMRDPVNTNHRVSPPVKRNNDQPQINKVNNNDNTNKDPKKNMPIVDTPSDDDELSTQGAYSTNTNSHLNNEYNNYSDTLQGVQLPCEFCQQMIDSESLILHETGCRPEYTTFQNVFRTTRRYLNKQNNRFPVPPLDLDGSSSDSELNLNTLSLSTDDDDDDNDDDDDDGSEKINVEKLPCEFCEKLISFKKLIIHQIKCEKMLVLNTVPIQNNLDKADDADEYNMHNVPSSKIIHETKRNLFKPPTSVYEPQTIQKLPRVRLHNRNRVNMRAVDNTARNHYEQFLSNSRLNHSELPRDNSNVYLNPSGGAIPKQRNTKPNNTQRVINDLSKRRNSDSSDDD